MRTKLKALLICFVLAAVADVAWMLYGIFGGVITQLTEFTKAYIVYAVITYILNIDVFFGLLREMKKAHRREMFADFFTKMITVIFCAILVYALAPLVLFGGMCWRIIQCFRTWERYSKERAEDGETYRHRADRGASREERPRTSQSPAAPSSAKKPFVFTSLSDEAIELLLDNERTASFVVSVEEGKKVKFSKVVALKEIRDGEISAQFIYGWAEGETRGFFPRAFRLIDHFIRTVTPTEQEIACNLYIHWQYGDSPSLLELSEEQDEKYLGGDGYSLDEVAELDDLYVRLSDGRMHLCRRVCYFSKKTGYGDLWGFWGAVCEHGGEYGPYDAVFLLIYATAEGAFVVQSVPGDPLYEECCAATYEFVQKQLDDAVMRMYEGEKPPKMLVGFDRKRACAGPFLAMIPDEERAGCGYIALAIETEGGAMVSFVHCVDDTHSVVSDEAEHARLFERLTKYLREEGV